MMSAKLLAVHILDHHGDSAYETCLIMRAQAIASGESPKVIEKYDQALDILAGVGR